MSLLHPRHSVRTILQSSSSSSTRRSHAASSCSLLEHNLPRRPTSYTPVRHATHGVQGRANGPKNGPGKRLGAKKTGDEYTVPGNILFRQRGTHWHPGHNTAMGRDHTIFSRAAGYVKYYRNPSLHPKRQYIGVVFEKHETLPVNPQRARVRRLGMVGVPRGDAGMVEGNGTVVMTGAGEQHGGPGVGVHASNLPTGHAEGELPIAQSPISATTSTAPSPSKRAIKDAKRKAATGRVDPATLTQGSDYSFRESNWQIGRAAERARVQVREFKKGDRFLAWRKRTMRVRATVEKRAVGGKKGKKDKPNRGGTRKGVGQPLKT